jgi:hypothetical protein
MAVLIEYNSQPRAFSPITMARLVICFKVALRIDLEGWRDSRRERSVPTATPKKARTKSRALPYSSHCSADRDVVGPTVAQLSLPPLGRSADVVFFSLAFFADEDLAAFFTGGSVSIGATTAAAALEAEGVLVVPALVGDAAFGLPPGRINLVAGLLLGPNKLESPPSLIA